MTDRIVGAETGLRAVMERVELVARSDVPVLIFGETGGGLKSQMQSRLKKWAAKTAIGESIAGMFQQGRSCKRPLGNGVPAMPHHLTVEERDRIAQLRYQGAGQKEIAKALGRRRNKAADCMRFPYLNFRRFSDGFCH